MAWFLRRIGIAIVLVWVVATLVFTAIHLTPGDPVEMLLSEGGVAPNPAAVAALRTKLGLDRPIHVQYLDAAVRLTRGDFGSAIADGASVGAEIARRLPRTLELVAAATLIAVLLGVPAGTVAATRLGSTFDRVTSAISDLMLAVPVFVAGTLLVLVFALQWRVLPAGGYVAFAQNPVQHILMLLMPAFAASLHLAAAVYRMTRTAVVDVATNDFVRSARAKGVPPRRILFHHILRNALIPVVTVVGLQMGTMLGGTVLVEFVFNWPGLSGFLVQGVTSRDYPVVTGVVLVIAMLFVLINLLVDLLYGVLDPRVRRA